jgi:hypothetical protein
LFFSLPIDESQQTIQQHLTLLPLRNTSQSAFGPTPILQHALLQPHAPLQGEVKQSG